MINRTRFLSLLLIAILLASAFPFVSTPAPAAAANDWTAQTSGVVDHLMAVWAASPSDVWAVGIAGAMTHYNGSAWTPVTEIVTPQPLYGVWGSSGSDVFAVGGNGTIVHYNGSTWSAMTSGTTDILLAVWGTSSSDVYASSMVGRVIHYDGSTWSQIDGSDGWSTFGIWGTSATNIFVVRAGGEIRHYNGTSWTNAVPTTEDLRAIWGASNNDIFAVGTNGTILHYNGSTWTAMTSGTTSTFWGVWGNAGNDVFAVTSEGTPYHYNGSTWSTMTCDTSVALYGVSGNCGTDVFAVGQSGTIVHYGTGCAPVIISFTPARGPTDTRVTITGQYFTGVTSVSFGGTPAKSYSVTSPTQIIADVGKGTTGKIRISTRSGNGASAIDFTFTNPDSNQVSTTPHGSSMVGSASSLTQGGPTPMAAISVKSASLSATKVAPGSPVTITADVVNSGTVNGATSIKVYVNGELENSQGVTVSSGSSTPVTFTVTRNEPGTYSVYVGGASAGSFTVDQFTPQTILIISGALVFFAFILGVIYMTRRKQAH